jgi:hypothetical protein
MTLKTAALLALVATLVLTLLLAADFLHAVIGVANGALPPIALLRSLIYVFASLCVMLFFYVFHRTQPR